MKLKDKMSLFPEENISTREIESWKTFADDLKSEDDLSQCYWTRQYSSKCNSR